MKPTPIGRFTDTPSYEELQREVARLRLTDAEREAFKLAAEWCRAYGGAVYDAGHAIDRFLERTK